MEKSQMDTLERKPKSKETDNDQQQIAKSVDNYPETGGVSIDEAKKQEGEMKIAEVKNEVEKNFPTDEPKIKAKEVVTVELPPNTPAIFHRLPEISPYVKGYMDDYNRRMNVSRFKKLINIFSYDAEELNKFALAAQKATGKGFQYKEVLAQKGPEGAWDYVKGFLEVKYRGLTKDGNFENKGTFTVAMGEESALKGGQ